MPFFGDISGRDMRAIMDGIKGTAQLEKAEVRAAQLEKALVALIDAVDAKDKAAIERALFVGRGLTF